MISYFPLFSYYANTYYSLGQLSVTGGAKHLILAMALGVSLGS